MSGRGHRRKGDRIEREIVDRHRELGIHAERYPLSGATRFRASGHDADIYVFGADEAPIKAEVKGRKNGAGFVTLENWIGNYDALFLRKDRAEPIVVVPWRVWAQLVERVRR
jgi:Holliday junction resolvase